MWQKQIETVLAMGDQEQVVFEIPTRHVKYLGKCIRHAVELTGPYQVRCEAVRRGSVADVQVRYTKFPGME